MEIWKDIQGYEGLYQVSNFGNIKSNCRGNGKFKNERILKLVKTKKGYISVRLLKNKIEKTYLVHRLVGLAFIDNLENKPCINHINGVKTDNNLLNLEWVTYRENNIHAFKTGLQNNLGRFNSGSKIVLDKVNGIYYDSIRDAAKCNGINEKSLGSYLRGTLKNKTNLVFA
jgi:hypothetical protein